MKDQAIFLKDESSIQCDYLLTVPNHSSSVGRVAYILLEIMMEVKYLNDH
jgi:hypothetical protein